MILLVISNFMILLDLIFQHGSLHQSENIPEHVEIVVLQRGHYSHGILVGLCVGQNTQDHALLAVLNVDHSELLLHGLDFLGGYNRLPDLTLDLLGQLVRTAAVRNHALFEHDDLAGDELHVGDHMSGNNDDLIKGDT